MIFIDIYIFVQNKLFYMNPKSTQVAQKNVLLPICSAECVWRDSGQPAALCFASNSVLRNWK